MTNEEALFLLDGFIEYASNAVQVGVWAQACLMTGGGDHTWDAVKGVSDIADQLATCAAKVAKLRDQYLNIVP